MTTFLVHRAGAVVDRLPGPGGLRLRGLACCTVVGRDEVDRKVAIHTISPVWDGNEVWLITRRGGYLRRLPGGGTAHPCSPRLYLALVLFAGGIDSCAESASSSGSTGTAALMASHVEPRPSAGGSLLAPATGRGRPVRPTPRPSDRRPAGVRRWLLRPAQCLLRGRRP